MTWTSLELLNQRGSGFPILTCLVLGLVAAFAGVPASGSLWQVGVQFLALLHVHPKD